MRKTSLQCTPRPQYFQFLVSKLTYITIYLLITLDAKFKEKNLSIYFIPIVLIIKLLFVNLFIEGVKYLRCVCVCLCLCER